MHADILRRLTPFEKVQPDEVLRNENENIISQILLCSIVLSVKTSHAYYIDAHSRPVLSPVSIQGLDVPHPMTHACLSLNFDSLPCCAVKI